VSYRYFELPFLRLKRYFAPGSMGWLRTDDFARFVPDKPSSMVGLPAHPLRAPALTTPSADNPTATAPQ
jgi:hypothetical protein